MAKTLKQNTWAMTVSDYILNRRQQIDFAYQAEHKQTLKKTNLEHGLQRGLNDDLFQIIFLILTQQIEQGHTVFILDKNDLFWYEDILTGLLLPILLLDGVDNHQDILLKTEKEFMAFLVQSGVDLYTKSQLQKYFRLARFFNNQFIKQNNCMDNTNDKNSLSDFIQQIQSHTLFLQIKEENHDNHQEINQPIIYQFTQDKIIFWLQRAWQAELALAYHIKRIMNSSVKKLPIQLNSHLNDQQKNAIMMANKGAFSIITGGPGTGKTYTVAQLVMALQKISSDTPSQDTLLQGINNEQQGTAPYQGLTNLALSAPTGKAAQRMQESLQKALDITGQNMQLQEAKTIHRLLGIGQNGKPRYHADNPLAEDIIIIDEASMLGVELANQLVSAIKPNARLILLGDANQLAAVDAGAVLADLCRIPALANVHQQLTVSRRFSDDSGVGKLAKLINHKTTMPTAINQQETKRGKKNQKEIKAKVTMEKVTNQNSNPLTAIWQLFATDTDLNFYTLYEPSQYNLQDKQTVDNSSKLLQTPYDFNKNSLSKNELYQHLLTNYQAYFAKTATYIDNIQQIDHKILNEVMMVFNQFRILTAGHHGFVGDNRINDMMSQAHKEALKLPLSNSNWYHGRPVMVLQNYYELGLFNGDIGICLQTKTPQGYELQVFFENKTHGIMTNMLNEEIISTAYAMTIHKSQGSEFTHVAVVFDDSNQRLLSQELIYTAITRAKERVSIYSTKTAFETAVMTPTQRQTGLALQF